MPPFDEPTLRKAASWQDFKEAQALINIGAVIEAEPIHNGWRGSVRAGSRTYRATVVARTPTWFDTTCSCPSNQREGAFCPHAIATGLHLISPPKPEVQKTLIPKTAIKLPEVSWKITFQGPWQTSLKKGHAALLLTTSDHHSSPADERITAWLISQKATSKSTIQLALNSQNLPSFLSMANGHPYVSTTDGPISIETGTQFQLEDCFPEEDRIHLLPGPETLLKIGDSFWKINPTSIAKIGETKPSEEISRVLLNFTSGKPATISKQSFPKSLESLQSFLDFSQSDWFESLQFIPDTPRFELLISGSELRLNITLFTSYSQPLPSFENQRITSSNPAAEANARALLSATLNSRSDTTFDLDDPEKIRQFLTKILPSLPNSWTIVLAPEIKKLTASYVIISPRIEILSSESDSIGFTLTFETDDGEVIAPAEIRRLLRSKNSSSLQLNGKRISLSDDIEDLIDPLFEDLDLQQENGRFIAKNASASIIREICTTLETKGKNSDVQSYPYVIHNAPVRAELRPYQSKGFSWLVDRLSRYGGALLADDMGLGKTLQSIACIEHLFATYSQPSPALVVVTTSLLGNWRSEFQRFAPNRRIITLHGTKRDSLREKIRPSDVILTTYGTLSRDLAWHLKQEYSIAVIDEASLIRNPDTDHSKAVAKLNATRRIALTGTPVENSARDLWAIFRFIQPGWLGTKKEFQVRYEIPLKDPETRDRTATLLRLKTSPFTLRRTKSEVAPELPSKILINELCTMSRDQIATYREIQKEGIRRIDEIRSSGQGAAARMQTLTTLLRLRQTCCDLALLESEKLRALPIPRRSAKLERLLEIAEQSISSGSRILVFSQFRKQLIEIGKALDDSGIPSIRLDGQTRDRQAKVDQFQSPDGPPVFLISLKAGGYGLNLTAADVVIHFDPWWNPAAEAQATDRAHRIGQTKPVTVFRLLTRDSVEENVVHLQSSKKALAESLDESMTPTNAPGWSATEMEKLLRD